MNWLEKLLEDSVEDCEHHIFAEYYISDQNPRFYYVHAGIPCVYPLSNFTKLSGRLQFNKYKRLLLAYIDQHKIQGIHFHFGHVAIKYKNWISKTGLPFCISLYGFDYEYLVYKNWQTKKDYLFLATLDAQFIVEGKYSKHKIQSYGIRAHQIHIVHMLFDRQIKPQTNKYVEPIRLFQAATFSEKKNQLGLVNSLESRHAGRFDISFYGEIVDTVYYKEFTNAIALQKNQKIKVSNLLKFSDYLSCLNQSHFVINLSKRTSTHDTEGGCPVLLKDGLSLAKPGISTKHCDIPELIIHGFNGYLLPENDPTAVIELLDRLLNLSSKEYKSLSFNAVAGIDANIKQNLSRQELLNVYQKMI